MKKIIWIIALVVILGALAYIVVAKPNVEKQAAEPKTFTQIKESDEENENSISLEEQSNEEIENNEIVEVVNKTELEEENKDTNKKEVKVTKLKDGTLYEIVGESIKPELRIGDNYFDTQMQDINLNFSKYDGKTVEIEGFFMEDTPYTFVGRYSESNICAFCPQGYAYFEYEWHGDNKFDFTNEKEWLKIVGTFKVGTDDLGQYYYIDASSIKVMNERGLDTVKN